MSKRDLNKIETKSKLKEKDIEREKLNSRSTAIKLISEKKELKFINNKKVKNNLKKLLL